MSEEASVCLDCRHGDGAFPYRSNGVLDSEKVAKSYLSQYRSKYGAEVDHDTKIAEETWWAWECLNDPAHMSPDYALNVILAALEICENDDEFSYLAAGPLDR